MEVKHISANPGSPSTFWSTDNVHWYTNKKDAEKNDTSKAVNPDDYVVKKSVWAANKKAFLWCLLIALLIGGGIYLYRKGTITIHRHTA